MDTLAVTVAPELRQRLEALAEQTGRSLEQCLEHAVFEFVENWETHLRDVEAMEAEGEDRPLLRAANE